MALGGTSNHFRASALQAVGGWDAFNVTEDADLGIRLARHGYRCGILDSTTYEEANTQLPNWMRQRRRWLKGFLQTWLVHMRNPLLLLRQTGLGRLSRRASPDNWRLCIRPAASDFAPACTLEYAARTTDGDATQCMGCRVFRLQLCNPVARLRVCAGNKCTRASPDRHRTLGKPDAYFPALLADDVTCAAWMALWDLIFAPFHWHKTQHGLSRLMAQKDHVA